MFCGIGPQAHRPCGLAWPVEATPSRAAVSLSYTTSPATPRSINTTLRYAVLLVDVRGRYGSGGSFQPIIQERRDGPDLWAWLGKQPWLDQKAGAGVIGLSYLATAGFLAAADNPLVRAMTCVTVVVRMEDSFYRAGALDLHHAFPWCVITRASPQPDLRRWDWTRLFRHLPLATLDRAADVDLPVWRQLVEAARTGSAMAQEMACALSSRATGAAGGRLKFGLRRALNCGYTFRPAARTRTLAGLALAATCAWGPGAGGPAFAARTPRRAGLCHAAAVACGDGPGAAGRPSAG